jgi:hypothetical protein
MSDHLLQRRFRLQVSEFFKNFCVPVAANGFIQIDPTCPEELKDNSVRQLPDGAAA